MKALGWLLLAILMQVSLGYGQVPVSVGSGSYASYPPASETADDWNNNGVGDLQQFLYTNPIYVAPNRINSPIPTNDWWTDLVVNGKNCGMLWAYPLSIDPDATGAKMYFANSFSTDGSNLSTGGYMQVSAAGFNSLKGYAKDWSDWGMAMRLADTVDNTFMDVTMAHGIPFMWLETQGLNPQFAFDKSASYLDETGAAISFPRTSSFVIKTNNKYFGIHLPPNVSAEIQGEQFVKIDLGSVQNFSKVKLNWETAYARAYSVSVSNDNVTFNTIASITNGDGGLDSIMNNSSGRYVKITLIERGTIYAYSLYEFRVYNGTSLLSQGRPVTVSSTQTGFGATNVNDGNLGTRWASDAAQSPKLIINTNNSNSYFVVSALPNAASLTNYETYAFNKVTNTRVSWAYNNTAGTVTNNWNITTQNLQGQANGVTIQGFLPHQYFGASHSINFTANDYVSPRGTMKTAIGNSFAFTYKFNGIIPSFNAPYRDSTKAHPYDVNKMFDLINNYSGKTTYGGDTYWGGKDLVNFAKYTLMAKELNHQSYASMRSKTRAALVNWLTYTPGETEKFFARYDRWKALVGFNESYGSSQFTDNHFHYGYLIHACALYSTVDQDFMLQYGPMIKLIAKQYANYERADTTQPFMRTMDPWIGHSYAGGTSSANGNNQESTSESMQAWIGLFLMGDVMNDAEMRAAGAFGYVTESNATLEYWFDWRERNLPAAYAHNMLGILSNQGFAYGTFFSASPVHIHGIQYLPVCPGFKYLAIDSVWAAREYADMMAEALATNGQTSELGFGDDWAHVALGFRQLYDPGYVAAFMETNLALPTNSTNYIMDYEVAGITYYYTHARQLLGRFSNTKRTNFPTSSVFESASGQFRYAVAYNTSTLPKVCTVYNENNTVLATFTVPARTLTTYPTPPTTGQTPTGCYGLTASSASASSGNANQAIDGNTGSRWESAFSDPQSITVDLGLVSNVEKITLTWEVANARNYQMLGSVNGTTWDTIITTVNTTTGNRTDIINNINRQYRYLKMYGTRRNTPYGYSIWEFKVCGTAIPLPPEPLSVNYLYFKGTKTLAGNQLLWATSSEKNNEAFEIERSANGQNFDKIGSVPGNGSINSRQQYSYSDTYTASAYYRLKQIDTDGKFEYSKIIFLGESEPSTMQVYPNPASETVTILSGDSTKKVELLNAFGQVAYLLKLNNNHEADIKDVVPGVYTVKATTTNGTLFQKLVVN